MAPRSGDGARVNAGVDVTARVRVADGRPVLHPRSGGSLSAPSLPVSGSCRPVTAPFPLRLPPADAGTGGDLQARRPGREAGRRGPGRSIRRLIALVYELLRFN